MTEAEALTLRNNGAKLYNHTRVAFYTAAEHLLQTFRITAADYSSADIQEAIDTAWDAVNLDDTFHTLSSQGYRSLIQAGWNPYVVNDDNNWQPSPDCIDHPTTRGGADSCDVTPDELHKTIAGNTNWEVPK